MGHLWVFSPTFFVLVWDLKGIVQRSVKKWVPLSIGASCRSSFVSTSTASYQSYGWTGRKNYEFLKEDKWCQPALHNESESTKQSAMAKITGQKQTTLHWARAKRDGKTLGKGKTTN